MQEGVVLALSATTRRWRALISVRHALPALSREFLAHQRVSSALLAKNNPKLARASVSDAILDSLSQRRARVSVALAAAAPIPEGLARLLAQSARRVLRGSQKWRLHATAAPRKRGLVPAPSSATFAIRASTATQLIPTSIGASLAPLKVTRVHTSCSARVASLHHSIMHLHIARASIQTPSLPPPAFTDSALSAFVLPLKSAGRERRQPHSFE